MMKKEILKVNKEQWEKAIKNSISLWWDYICSNFCNTTEDKKRASEFIKKFYEMLTMLEQEKGVTLEQFNWYVSIHSKGGITMTIEQLAKDYPLPGWYLDVCGNYGCMIGRYWIAVFIDVDGRFNVTVDGVDSDGSFSANIEWEDYANAHDAIVRAKKFIIQYLDK